MVPGVERQLWRPTLVCCLCQFLKNTKAHAHTSQECICMFSIYGQGHSGNLGFFIYKMGLLIFSPLIPVGMAQVAP